MGLKDRGTLAEAAKARFEASQLLTAWMKRRATNGTAEADTGSPKRETGV